MSERDTQRSADRWGPMTGTQVTRTDDDGETRHVAVNVERTDGASDAAWQAASALVVQTVERLDDRGDGALGVETVETADPDADEAEREEYATDGFGDTVAVPAAADREARARLAEQLPPALIETELSVGRPWRDEPERVSRDVVEATRAGDGEVRLVVDAARRQSAVAASDVDDLADQNAVQAAVSDVRSAVEDGDETDIEEATQELVETAVGTGVAEVVARDQTRAMQPGDLPPGRGEAVGDEAEAEADGETETEAKSESTGGQIR